MRRSTVNSKFLLRDRLGSYLCFESGYDNGDFFNLSKQFHDDAKTAHSLTV